MWLFDTVALSELTKPRADSGFLSWAECIPEKEVHTSVLCLGEIRRGIVLLPPGPKRHTLTRWLEIDLPQRLGVRALSLDDRVAQRWGDLGARGATAPVDALIGATAAEYGLTIVTRNVRDFDGLGVPVLNPWTGVRSKL